MALEDLNPEKMREDLLKSSKRSDGTYSISSAMLEDIVSYYTHQFNDASVRTCLNYEEYRHLAKEAVSGLYFLIYIKHYQEGENLLEKESHFIATQNWLLMMYRAVIGGGFAKTIVAENQSRVAPNMILGATR